MEKTVLLLGIVGITAFSFITKETKENPPTSPKKEITQPAVKEMPATIEIPTRKKPVITEKRSRTLSLPKNVVDTLPRTNVKESIKGERTFPSISSNTNNDGNTLVTQIEATDNTGKQYRIKRVDGKITELVADGTTIPESRYGEYDELIRRIDETQRQNTVKIKEGLRLKKVERDQLLEKKAAIAKEKNKDRIEKMELRRDSVKAFNLRKTQTLKLARDKNELRKKDYDIQKAEITEKKKLFKEERKSSDYVSRIISDLNNQKLVSDPENLSFSLNNKELIVNGTKQPAEIHQQFKEKYIQSSTDLYNYSKHGNTTSITISRNK